MNGVARHPSPTLASTHFSLKEEARVVISVVHGYFGESTEAFIMRAEVAISVQ